MGGWYPPSLHGGTYVSPPYLTKFNSLKWGRGLLCVSPKKIFKKNSALKKGPPYMTFGQKKILKNFLQKNKCGSYMGSHL